MRLGAFGENIKNQRGPIDDLDIEKLLEVSLLGWRKFVVENDKVIVELFAEIADFLEFAFADIRAGQGVTQLLR